jgi:hypothetical protein
MGGVYNVRPPLVKDKKGGASWVSIYVGFSQKGKRRNKNKIDIWWWLL